MANIIDSVKDIATDTWWVPKILVLSYLTFLIVLNFGYLMEHTSHFILLGSITGFIFIGCATVLVGRNINNESPLLPGLFNFPEVIIKAIVSLILMLPASVIYYYVNNYMQAHPFFEQPVHGAITVIVALLFSPFIFVPVVLFASKGRIQDGYRFDLILQSGGDFIVKILSFALQYFFVIFLFSFLVYLGIKAMLGEESTGIYIFIAFMLTLSFFSFFAYLSDLYGESIPMIKVKHKSVPKADLKRHKR